MGQRDAVAHPPRGLRRCAAVTFSTAGASTPEEAPVSDDPVDLDTRRSAGNLIAADIRRHSLRDFEADQSDLCKRQEELEAQLLAEPAQNWREAAARAQYLIRRYAETAEAQDARKQKLVARALGDLARLMEDEK
jgi:hypothetical protein